MNLDCYVINLRRTPERAERIIAQLNSLGIKHKRFFAIDGMNGEHEVWKNYEVDTCVQHFGVPLLPGEVGCFASHFALWQRCAESGRPVLIFEDDTELLDSFAEAVALAERHIEKCGLIRMAGLVDRKARIRPLAEAGARRLVRLLRGPLGTQAYMLSPRAANALIQGASRWIEPVDLYLDRFWSHGVIPYAVVPYSAIHGAGDGTEATSTITPIGAPKRQGRGKLRRELRRIGQNVSRGLYNLIH